MSLSLRELALEEAQLKALADLVDDRLKDVRKAVQVEMKAAQKASGTKSIAVQLPDGTPVASITLPEASKEARITDSGAFLAWVLERYPAEVERQFVTMVRPAFAKKVLAEATAAGVARIADKETGELHALPGVEIKALSSGLHRLTPRAGGPALIAEAWRSGLLKLPAAVAPALPGGE
jgi:hypothetical protein